MITKEEQNIVHQYILLLIAKKALEVDLSQLEKSPLKFKEPYMELLVSLLDKIGKELGIIKRYMNQHQLKVNKKNNDGMFSKYEYFCRGYHSTHHYLNTHLKNQVSEYITSCIFEDKKTHKTS
ncbi:hypothetical protein [Bacillus sp. FJAT-45350]|uniref:hypothetical protein n=1 Tax=Bacillus sp. FJAT-45350 TaxID=2011014 RepID=UPI000BB6F0DF|nr:hypothetical protein [Bacillus sp. FJAT-45350]